MTPTPTPETRCPQCGTVHPRIVELELDRNRLLAERAAIVEQAAELCRRANIRCQIEDTDATGEDVAGMLETAIRSLPAQAEPKGEAVASAAAIELADKIAHFADDGSEGFPFSQDELDLIIASLRHASPQPAAEEREGLKRYIWPNRDADGYCYCKFCGCHTNARALRCCNAAIDAAQQEKK